MEKAIKGEIEEVIIAYKDRLTRFGFEMIEWLIKKYSNGKIVIINKEEEETPIEELTKDVVSIMNVYVAKVNGLRKYKTHLKEKVREWIVLSHLDSSGQNIQQNVGEDPDSEPSYHILDHVEIIENIFGL